MHAAENGHVLVVKYLMEMNACPYASTPLRHIPGPNGIAKKVGGQNALELAILNNHPETVKVILLSNSWEECLRNGRINPITGKVSSPLRLLIQKFPELAKRDFFVILVKCM